jgi:hypothetical protein
MSKRFFDTTIFEEDWFLEAPDGYSLFWFYMCARCDHGGIFKPNVALFNRTFQKDISKEKVFAFYNNDKERVRVLPNGRWFLEDFIVFQYGKTLTLTNPVHKSIVNLLALNEVSPTSIRGLIEVRESAKDEDKDKDNSSFKNKGKRSLTMWELQCKIKALEVEWTQRKNNGSWKTKAGQAIKTEISNLSKKVKAFQ